MILVIVFSHNSIESFLIIALRISDSLSIVNNFDIKFIWLFSCLLLKYSEMMTKLVVKSNLILILMDILILWG